MLFMPMVQLILLGYTATSDIRHLHTAVFDADRSLQSRQLIEAYRASDYFEISHYVQNEDEMGRLLDRGEIRTGIIIPSGYSESLGKGKTAQVGFVIDGSDPSVATTAFAAAQSVGQALSTKVVQERLGIDMTTLGGVEVRPRVWYNPDMRSANYMIPGLIGLILQFLTILFTAQTIVREREQGTIEQLVVTPIKSWELIVGKVIQRLHRHFQSDGDPCHRHFLVSSPDAWQHRAALCDVVPFSVDDAGAGFVHLHQRQDTARVVLARDDDQLARHFSLGLFLPAGSDARTVSNTIVCHPAPLYAHHHPRHRRQGRWIRSVQRADDRSGNFRRGDTSCCFDAVQEEFRVTRKVLRFVDCHPRYWLPVPLRHDIA
jgi:hypothetical protein